LRKAASRLFGIPYNDSRCMSGGVELPQNLATDKAGGSCDKDFHSRELFIWEKPQGEMVESLT
jgi:hypothetical protein